MVLLVILSCMSNRQGHVDAYADAIHTVHSARGEATLAGFVEVNWIRISFIDTLSPSPVLEREKGIS